MEDGGARVPREGVNQFAADFSRCRLALPRLVGGATWCVYSPHRAAKKRKKENPLGY